MFVQVNSTRHTSAGTFRAGVVYNIHDKNHRALAAVKPHLEKGGPMKKLTKAQAEKVAAAVVSLIPAEVIEAEQAAAEQAAAEQAAADQAAADQAAADQAAADQAGK